MTTITLENLPTNLQMELLKLFSLDLPEKRLLALKELISDFLLDVARDEADKAWDAKKYTIESIEKKLQEGSKH